MGVLDIKKRKEVKNATKERVQIIEQRIRDANKIYKKYLQKGKHSTRKDFLQLCKAVVKFYNDERVETVVGGGMYTDLLPVSMYASLQNNKHYFCRAEIKKMDKELAKDGIFVNEMLSFIKKEKCKFVSEEKIL